MNGALGVVEISRTAAVVLVQRTCVCVCVCVCVCLTGIDVDEPDNCMFSVFP